MKCKHCDKDAVYGIETIVFDNEMYREWEYINYVCADCANTDQYEELERMSVADAEAKWGSKTCKRIL